MAERSGIVPWARLFPTMDARDVISDSTQRKRHRHYRVKLPLPHSMLAEAQAKLKPYGFTCEAWRGSGRLSRNVQMIKATRNTPLPAKAPVPARSEPIVVRAKGMDVDGAMLVARTLMRGESARIADVREALIVLANNRISVEKALKGR